MAASPLASFAPVEPTREPRSRNNRLSPDDSLLSFNTEATVAPEPIPELIPEPTPAAAVPPRRRSTPFAAAATGVVLMALALAVVQAKRSPDTAPLPAATTGILDITSQPPGAGISIDGESRGTTPLRLSLAVGPHLVDVSAGGRKRTLPVNVGADTVLSQHIEFAGPATSSGRLEVTTDNPGAQVLVDGSPRGLTPLLIDDIAAGEHAVTIARDGAKSERKVTITAGATAMMIANTPAAAAVAAGWLRIDAPFELQVFESGRLVGTTGDRLMLPAGRHDLSVRSGPFGFNSVLHPVVSSGNTSVASVTVPKGTLSINAFPWAEVSIDGRTAGLTPLGNLSVPIGPHEVVWRHPQLGERRQTVAVTATSPVGVGMDLTK